MYYNFVREFKVLEVSMQKEITIKEFSAELIQRINSEKGIDCCKDEIKRFAELAAKKIPAEMIKVTWQK